MLLSSLQMGLLLSILHPALAIPFPAPSGPYNTTLQIVQLIDKNRIDPSSPTRQPRSLMVSIFTPVQPSTCNPLLIPYMDPTTTSFQDGKFAAYGLPPGLFGALELRVCSSTPRSTPRQKANNYPVVIFSPALATTRLFYNGMAQQLSSQGYIVISVDHPYDVDVVTYPDNSTILGLEIPDEDLVSALNTRVKDISFVLNQLARARVSRPLFPTLSCGIDVSRVGVFGHSFGGAAAAEALLYDRRLVAGANLDGTFFGKVAAKGTSKPFLIFAHEGKNRTTDYSWDAIWPKLTGFKRELEVRGAQHYAFSDLPVVVKTLGIADAVQEMLGTIDGGRMSVVAGTYLEAFFGKFLKGGEEKILDRESKDFPEVSFASK